MVSYKQITSANDWFHVSHLNGVITLSRVAVWALTKNGNVVGLTSCDDNHVYREHEVSRLFALAGTKAGTYKHRNDLSDEERLTLSKMEQQWDCFPDLLPEEKIE